MLIVDDDGNVDQARIHVERGGGGDWSLVAVGCRGSQNRRLRLGDRGGWLRQQKRGFPGR